MFKRTTLMIVAIATLGITISLGGEVSAASSAKVSVMVKMVGGEKMYSNKDIVSNVVNAPNLTTLVAAVKAGGLVEVLQGAGPFTVFGPDNNAFAKIDAKTLEFLLKPENKAALANILTYHVVSGKYTIAKLKNGQILTTVQGGKLKITKMVKKMKGKYMTTAILTDEKGGMSKVITADVFQKNGVAHVVNTVLMPKDKVMKKETMMKSEVMMKSDDIMVSVVGGEKMYSNKDIVSNVVNAPNLTTLVAAVKAGGLVEVLQGAGPFTVFGPDNNAFAKIDAKTLEFLLKPENKAALANILTYHVVSGKYTINDLSDGQKLPTVQGGMITITKSNGKIMITDEKGGISTVITSDVLQKNGVAHVIDTVLMPSK